MYSFFTIAFLLSTQVYNPVSKYEAPVIVLIVTFADEFVELVTRSAIGLVCDIKNKTFFNYQRRQP